MKTTLIVSDIHLGAHNSQGPELLSLLQTDFDRLILNGDTIDHLNFARFRSQDWAVLSELQAIAQERELVLIRGNHEGNQDSEHRVGPLDVLARLLGVDLHEEFVVEIQNQRYLILHGDQFDSTLNLTNIGYAAEGCYKFVQRCSRPVARWLKSCVKHYCGVVHSVSRGAIAYAHGKNCQGVITGHTHYHEDLWIDGLHYVNTGCWVDWPCTYLEIRGSHIKLCSWHQNRSELLTDRRVLPHQAMSETPVLRPEPVLATNSSEVGEGEILVAHG